MQRIQINQYIFYIYITIPKSKNLDFDYATNKRFPPVEFCHIDIHDKITDIIILRMVFPSEYIYDIMETLAMFSTSSKLRDRLLVDFNPYESWSVSLAENQHNVTALSFTSNNESDTIRLDININTIPPEYKKVYIMSVSLSQDDINTFFNALDEERKL